MKKNKDIKTSSLMDRNYNTMKEAIKASFHGPVWYKMRTVIDQGRPVIRFGDPTPEKN